MILEKSYLLSQSHVCSYCLYLSFYNLPRVFFYSLYLSFCNLPHICFD
ncbi:hypothetical protein ACJIZ3_004586 [Penstemon smallii]|uniref:Uncharacterized protein n=1 Tax=Penstemon smallii TaxID=265156 RepID=A0ABD3S2P2_9LAMI